MQVEFRALHDVPAGEEITQSYFPLNVDYVQRQQRLQGDYGFTCTCPRCQVSMSPHVMAVCLTSRPAVNDCRKLVPLVVSSPAAETAGLDGSAHDPEGSSVRYPCRLQKAAHNRRHPVYRPIPLLHKCGRIFSARLIASSCLHGRFMPACKRVTPRVMQLVSLV